MADAERRECNLEASSADLEDAERAGDEARLELLEDLHGALREELDADPAPSAGR